MKQYPIEEQANPEQMKDVAEDDDDDDDNSSSSDMEDKKRPHHHGHHGHHGHHHHPCVVECYFNKTGVYKDRQVVKATALKLFSDNTDSSGNFQALLSSSIDTCMAERE